MSFLNLTGGNWSHNLETSTPPCTTPKFFWRMLNAAAFAGAIPDGLGTADFRLYWVQPPPGSPQGLYAYFSYKHPPTLTYDGPDYVISVERAPMWAQGGAFAGVLNWTLVKRHKTTLNHYWPPLDPNHDDSYIAAFSNDLDGWQCEPLDMVQFTPASVGNAPGGGPGAGFGGGPGAGFGGGPTPPPAPKEPEGTNYMMLALIAAALVGTYFLLSR